MRLVVQAGAPSIAAPWAARLCTVRLVVLLTGLPGALLGIDRHLLAGQVTGLRHLLHVLITRVLR